MRRKKTGFTLVELLITFVIMAVLAALSMASFVGAKASARDSQRKTELEQIRSALEVYRADNGSYPVYGGNVSGIAGSLTNYISMPADPDTSLYYRYVSAGSTYALCARLETGSSGSGGCIGQSCGGQTCNYLTENP